MQKISITQSETYFKNLFSRETITVSQNNNKDNTENCTNHDLWILWNYIKSYQKLKNRISWSLNEIWKCGDKDLINAQYHTIKYSKHGNSQMNEKDDKKKPEYYIGVTILRFIIELFIQTWAQSPAKYSECRRNNRDLGRITSQ